MCLNPLTIRNPTKVVHNGGGHLLTMQIPCGTCAQCQQTRRNEWYVRTHYEMHRTFSLGGYVYFDTLTYADEHLPKLSHFCDIAKYGIKDFSCFNREHFKAFLKRLRRRLHYKFKVPSNAFRYFLTSEYGVDDRYTHRPHYHILFFVYADISPLDFSQQVAESWHYGRTDGYPYKPSNYIYQHVYGHRCGKDNLCDSDNTDFTTVTSVAMYVSKYINKSTTFGKRLEERITAIKNKVYKYSLGRNTISDEDEQMITDLRRNIDMFHRQSQGFGLSFLDNMTPEKLMFIDNNQMCLKDSKQVVKTYLLPMYYKRKLFYNLKKHSDGSRYWELSKKGLAHQLNTKLQLIDKMSLKYMDIVRNCAEPDYIDRFFSLLGERDISDYVIYEQFYKGRHRHINAINYQLQQPLNHLTDEEVFTEDWLLSITASCTPYNARLHRLALDEKGILRTPILKDNEIDNYQLAKFGHHSHMLNNSHSEHISSYIQRYTFNENSDPSFADFDKIGVLLQHMTLTQREALQTTFDYLEELKMKFKQLYNLNL